MRRREFLALVGGAAAWSSAARAQQALTKTIGWLSLRSADTDTELANLSAFRQGLKETGYVEGKNLTIEFRYGGGRYEGLSALADDLVRRQVAVIVCGGGAAVTRTVQRATSTIPIVFASASDPVQDGIVTSINRRRGNTTGVHMMNVVLGPRRLEILRERCLREPDTTGERRTSDGCRPFFPGPPRPNRRTRVATPVPTMYEWSEFVKAGGLISYSTDRNEMWRQMGIYVTRILNGAKPGDLPVMQPTKFELVINLKTAKESNIEIPPSLLARADEVIE